MKRRLARVLFVAFLVGCATGTSAPPIAWRDHRGGRRQDHPRARGHGGGRRRCRGTRGAATSGSGATGDTGGIEAVGAARFEPSGGVPGQGGLIHLQFRVVRAGATVLWLAYQRPFQNDAAPEQTFSLTIVGEAAE